MIEKIKEIFERVQKDIEKEDPKYPGTFDHSRSRWNLNYWTP